MTDKRIFLVWAIALLLLAACAPAGPGQGTEPTAAPTEPAAAQPTEPPVDTPTPAPTEAPTTGGEIEVAMRNTTFVPEEITVAPGTTVIWTNEDSLPHTVTSSTRDNPSDMFASGNLGNGESFEFTFEEAGTYDYYCTIHPGMNGTVIVE